MSLQEILLITTPLFAVISTLAGYLYHTEVANRKVLQEQLDELEAENKTLVAAIAVGTTTEEMRQDLADYLRGGGEWRAGNPRRRR